MIGNFPEFFEIATDIAFPTNSVAVKEVFDGKSSSTTSSSIHGLEELCRRVVGLECKPSSVGQKLEWAKGTPHWHTMRHKIPFLSAKKII
jgi:hypothetical protein